MGNEQFVVTSKTPTYVTEQNRLFREYQQKMVNNPKQAAEEKERWESVKHTITQMTLEQQAEYADYVTENISKMDMEIVIGSAREMVDSFQHAIGSLIVLNACAIGNAAKLILALDRFSENDIAKELRTALMQQFQGYLTMMKIRDYINSKPRPVVMTDTLSKN